MFSKEGRSQWQAPSSSKLESIRKTTRLGPLPELFGCEHNATRMGVEFRESLGRHRFRGIARRAGLVLEVIKRNDVAVLVGEFHRHK